MEVSENVVLNCLKGFEIEDDSLNDESESSRIAAL